MPVTQLPIEHMPLRFLSIYGPFDRAGTLNSAKESALTSSSATDSIPCAPPTRSLS